MKCSRLTCLSYFFFFSLPNVCHEHFSVLIVDQYHLHDDHIIVLISLSFFIYGSSVYPAFSFPFPWNYSLLCGLGHFFLMLFLAFVSASLCIHPSTSISLSLCLSVYLYFSSLFLNFPSCLIYLLLSSLFAYLSLSLMGSFFLSNCKHSALTIIYLWWPLLSSALFSFHSLSIAS